jgi:UDP-2-acetamido-3-amino-2,3-dideoxy-glucuronate N-acetyltransferase
VSAEIFVSASAIVEPEVVLGAGSRVWHFCHVMNGAQIGERCSLGMGCFVARGVVIGNGVRLQNNVSVYQGVVLEDDVFCGPSAVFTNVDSPRAFVSKKHEFRATHVERGATIGANATIVCGVRIGRYAFVGAGAVVCEDVPPFALVIGNPARLAGFRSRQGEALSFDASGLGYCPVTGEAYRKTGDDLVQLEAEIG